MSSKKGKYKLGGWRPGARPDRRDSLYQPPFLKNPIPEPDQTNNRPLDPPVRDQGQEGDCVGFGTTGAFASAYQKTYFPNSKTWQQNWPIFDPQFVYYNGRVIEGTTKTDSGLYVRDGNKAIQKWGVPTQAQNPYKAGNLRKPAAKIYKLALNNKEVTYYNITRDQITQAIAQGYRVTFGTILYNGFYDANAANAGAISLPRIAENPIGGHCMFITDYCKSKNYFVIQNSWNIDFGEAGYCRFPMDFFLNGTTDANGNYMGPDGPYPMADDFWIIEVVSVK